MVSTRSSTRKNVESQPKPKISPRKGKTNDTGKIKTKSTSRSATKILSPARTFEGSDDQKTKTPKRSQQKTLYEQKIEVLEDLIKSIHSGGAEANIVGREDEERDIQEFIMESIHDNQSATLYISGSTGTGKTKLVDTIVRKLQTQKTLAKDGYLYANSFETVSIHKKPGALIESIGPFLGFSAKDVKALGTILRLSGIEECVERMIELRKSQKRRTMKVIVLDEVDALDRFSDRGSRGNDILMGLFEFAMTPESKTILIAIANTVNLVSEVVSNLLIDPSNSRLRTIIFQPYLVNDLRAIILDNVLRAIQNVNSNLAVDDVINPTAMELCIRRIAANTGDCRQTLDAFSRFCASAILDLRQNQDDDEAEAMGSPPKKARISPRETETGSEDSMGNLAATITAMSIQSPVKTKSGNKENDSCEGSAKTSSNHNEESNFESPAVTIQAVQAVLDAQFKNAKSRNSDVLHHMPLHQQLLLVAILSLELDDGITLLALEKRYVFFCRRLHVAVPSNVRSSVVNGLKALESTGLVKTEIRKATGVSNKRRTTCTADQMRIWCAMNSTDFKMAIVNKSRVLGELFSLI